MDIYYYNVIAILSAVIPNQANCKGLYYREWMKKIQPKHIFIDNLELKQDHVSFSI